MLDPSGSPARDLRSRTLAALALSALAGQAHAGFFIPRDITMFMFTASPDAQMAEVAHGFRADLSVAAGQSRYLSDDESIERRYTTLQANWLVHRHYGRDGIANAYIYGGPLAARGSAYDEAGTDSGSRSGVHGGFWMDYETRRIYTRLSTHLYHAGSQTQAVTTAQALWAPYAADYEDIALWFGLQAERRSTLSDATQITPLVRVFQRRWWVDVGVSVNSQHRGDGFVNVMLLF
ncbi:hypothetical protein [Methyloversatilis sp. XJ19-49]|uniref:hypothetical protein n=1 Tax=Methyloversatilis sp. XJ19-49 TaxID=2963429 RepID=UPI00211CDC59|nr:hypothetical protein [Methyloversatilis sp. XJ19-49]MCQ9378990.1 hypothetical protein [Methyloversatilis sp. XJ19-49]